ncbi:CD82 antigen, partial [Galemys pyrenaicus]
ESASQAASVPSGLAELPAGQGAAGSGSSICIALTQLLLPPGSTRTSRMGSACIKVTKYFLFLFNLLFFILGAVILGFGVWILADKSSFVAILHWSGAHTDSPSLLPAESSRLLNLGAYVFIGVGTVTMFMGFLGCIGAINEVRCLLGLYFTFLLLILIAQVAAGVIFYFNMGQLKEEMGDIVAEVIRDYKDSHEDNVQDAWDYVQAQVRCCGWVSFMNWTDNADLMNRTTTTFPCSCEGKNASLPVFPVERGFCELSSIGSQSGNDPNEWPVYHEGCMEKVQEWLQSNLGVILGVCVGVAVIELLGMLLAICLCRHVHSEDYSKVPKY